MPRNLSISSHIVKLARSNGTDIRQTVIHEGEGRIQAAFEEGGWSHDSTHGENERTVHRAIPPLVEIAIPF